MPTREISRDQWTNFFDDFSRRHAGRLVRVEVLGALGAQIEARDLPLTGITADRDATHTISILVGGRPDDDAAHIIARPARVLLEEEDGVEPALDIQTEDGETTLVTLSAAPAAQMASARGPGREAKRD